MKSEFRKNTKGRGATRDMANRFEKNRFEAEAQEWDGYLEDEKPLLRTQFIPDSSKTIVNENNSPDIGFRYSINAYRGCEHGCAYCYARPTHEYLGFSPGLDFESKIMVKYEAASLLRERLMLKSWQPEAIFMSGVTDCYQPAERQFELTRGCLRVLNEFRNPTGIITKNRLVTRDKDILAEMAAWRGTVVFLSVTSLDADLTAVLEPRTSRPQARLAAIRELHEAGIPVGVNVAPVIPGLNDHEMPAILKAAREAGAEWSGFTPVRLPLAVAPLFREWLEAHRPEKAVKVEQLIQDMRGGKMNDSQFGSRMRGEGPIAKNLEQMFDIHSRRLGFNTKSIGLSAEHFRRPGDQMSLF